MPVRGGEYDIQYYIWVMLDAMGYDSGVGKNRTCSVMPMQFLLTMFEW
jgi:hypothetical protein